MARIVCFVASSLVALALFLVPVHAQQGAASAIPVDLQKLMQTIKSADTDLLAVSEEDGRFLRVMVASSGVTRAPRLAARTATRPSGSGSACARPAAG